MLKAVLFDLDGTLLDIDLGSFLGDYFAALAPVLAELSDGSLGGEAAAQAVNDATRVMCSDHPDRTNREVFHEAFLELTGIDLDEPACVAAVDDFYATRFPALQASAGPMPGGADAVQAARDAGMSVAIATNPIFPAAAIHHRIRWAGFSANDFAHVTTYETSKACKPSHAYFRAIAAALGVEPAECLMVGDDAALDLAAADIGMSTFYTGPSPATSSHWCGTLTDLAALIPRLV